MVAGEASIEECHCAEMKRVSIGVFNIHLADLGHNA